MVGKMSATTGDPTHLSLLLRCSPSSSATPQGVAADPAIRDAFTRFERAKQTNAKWAARTNAIRQELSQVNRRKIELYTMNKMNVGQRAVWLGALDETIALYSRAWNSTFAEKIQRTFPFEIRSIVYDYLLDDAMWEGHQYALQAVMSAVPPEVGHCRCLINPNGLPRVPHYVLSQYMGNEAAQEIVAKVYRSAWLKEWTVYGISVNLDSLLYKDGFGAGFDPSSCIKSLSIICYVDKHRRPRGSNCRDENCQHGPGERRYIKSELRSDFDQLIGAAGSKDFRSLDITFLQRNFRIDVLEEALEAFRPAYEAFKKKGVEIRIRWEYANLDCDCSEEHGRDLAKFFIDPRFIWKRRMFQFLDRTASCIQTEHIKWENEPSLVLSDTDFVHRMWESDEDFDSSDDEDSNATDCERVDWDDDSDEINSAIEGQSQDQSTLPISAYFRAASLEL